MGYINRNQGGVGTSITPFFSSAVEDEDYCVRYQGVFTTLVNFGFVGSDGNLGPLCGGMQHIAQLVAGPSISICSNTSLTEPDPECTYNRNYYTYDFYTEPRTRLGQQPLCSIRSVMGGGLLGPSDITPETWACLERWCNQTVDYDNVCDLKGELVIKSVYERGLCIDDYDRAVAVYESFEGKEPVGPEGFPVPVTGRGEIGDFMRPFIEKAYFCICQAARERNVVKLQHALLFLDTDYTYGECLKKAKIQCKDELMLPSTPTSWTIDEIRAYRECLTNKLTSCVEEIADQLLDCL